MNWVRRTLFRSGEATVPNALGAALVVGAAVALAGRPIKDWVPRWAGVLIASLCGGLGAIVMAVLGSRGLIVVGVVGGAVAAMAWLVFATADVWL